MGKISGDDAPIAAELAEAGYLRRTEETYEPAIMVMKPAEIRRAVESMDAETRSELIALADRTKEQLENLRHSITEILRSDLPVIFSQDDYQCGIAVDSCYFIRGFILEEALRMEYLLPADKVSPAVGVYMDLI